MCISLEFLRKGCLLIAFHFTIWDLHSALYKMCVAHGNFGSLNSH
jgi:hypothetical protein